MLLAVAQIQARGGTLVVEAGTGTGKGMAFLVPSIARAVRHRERVVVSTNTHTLQEQLMTKDLPGLREWLPWDFKACLLKGRSNYVSLRRWRRYLSEPCKDAEELMLKLKVLIWLHTTESGDRSELRLHGREEVLWNRIASDPLDCVGIHCTKEDCYVHRARAEAETADLVVINHALLLADVEVGGGLLPEFDHLVIDEAHHLEEAATRGLRQEVDGPGLIALLERLARRDDAGRMDGLLEELQRQPHLGASGEAFMRRDANRVYWFSQVSRAENLLLRAAPINVGSLLRERVYAERRSTVFTSATLAVGGTFDYFSSRVGLGAEIEELILPSPFDFYHQALVCLPTDIPLPEDEGFDLAAEELIAAVARRAGGRTLALFTSHRQLRGVHAALKQRVDLDDVLILGQGIDGQRRQLLKTFEEAERPLLLGTSSFWEGIDIPGERLSCVIIVRLPFPVPTDPIYAARADQVRDPFSQLALPQAALRLKQGFGRLIRRSTDRGAVAILDHRILGRDYGKAFLEVLPPASRFVGPAAEVADRIGAWLQGV